MLPLLNADLAGNMIGANLGRCWRRNRGDILWGKTFFEGGNNRRAGRCDWLRVVMMVKMLDQKGGDGVG